MPKIPKVYSSVLKEHRKKLLRLTERRALPTMKAMYERSIMDLEKKLRKIPGGRKTSFTAHQHRLFLGQLRQGLAIITRAMAGGLGDLSREAQTEALRGLIGNIGRLEKKFTGADIVLPIQEAGKFQKIISGNQTSLMKVHKVSSARYGARLIKKFEDQLSASLMQGENVGDAIDRIMDTADVEWYQAERIARTEILAAHGKATADGIKETAKEFDDMMMRWVENVDDSTYRGLDGRVSLDSIAMHGQVANPGGLFYFPSSLPSGVPTTISRPGRKKETWDRVLGRFRGQSWASTPLRPQGRESIQPVRPHWGIHGWRSVGGRRVAWP